MNWKKTSKNIMVSVSALFFFLALFELFLYLTDWDIRILKPILFFENANGAVGQASENAERLYELRPGATRAMDRFSPKEEKSPGQTRAETINSLGFRDKERSADKPEGIYRIIIFGGSNTYGALVGDEETYPAYAQKILDEKYPGRYEVWNAGLHGYTLSQEIAYAEEVLEKYQPDLFIFQIGNVGRRGFEANLDFTPYFKKNPELFLENLPLPYLAGQRLTGAHDLLLSFSRVYRFFIAGWNILNVERLKIGRGDQISQNFQSERELDYFLKKGDAISLRDARSFIDRYPELDAIFFINPSLKPDCTGNELIPVDARCFTSSCDGLPPEYYDVHPPSYVYRWTAQKVVDYLEANGYVK